MDVKAVLQQEANQGYAMLKLIRVTRSGLDWPLPSATGPSPLLGLEANSTFAVMLKREGEKERETERKIERNSLKFWRVTSRTRTHRDAAEVSSSKALDPCHLIG